MRLFFSIGMLVFGVGGSVAQEIANQQVADQQAIVAKMKAAWAHYRQQTQEHFSAGWDITVKLASEVKADKNPSPNQNQVRYINNGAGYILIEHGEQALQLANPVYSFMLLKRKQLAAEDQGKMMLYQFQLAQGKQQEYVNHLNPGTTLYDESRGHTFEHSLTIFGRKLEFYFDQPYFKITKITDLEVEGKKVVQVAFTCEHDPLEEPRNVLQEGEITFFADSFWLPRSFSVRGIPAPNNLQIVKSQFTYSEGPLPLLKAYETQFEYKAEKRDSKISHNATIAYAVPSPDQFPANRFTLTHYNIPEPQGVTWPSSFSIYPWLIASLSVACALLVLFWILTRWRRKAVATA